MFVIFCPNCFMKSNPRVDYMNHFRPNYYKIKVDFGEIVPKILVGKFETDS
jgi:hypothetical protein